MSATDMGSAADVLRFVDAGPSPFHAAAATAQRLEEAGFAPLDERERWKLAPGDCRYVVRDGGSIVAFRVGGEPPSTAGFRLVGAHTDAPTLKVRPQADLGRHGYRQLGVEPYGGLLAHTWLDRDLTLAGRVVLRAEDGTVERCLVRLPGAPLRVPSLAAHLAREIREEGLRLDAQRHLVPVWDQDLDGEPHLAAALGEQLGVEPDRVLAHELVTADTQPAGLGGARGSYLFAPRLDNLLSCHAGLAALVDVGQRAHTQVLVANDHEEAGSNSAEGAAGPFLADTLRRVTAACEGHDPEALPVATARSVLVSVDTAHAVHPNYAERHEAAHRPRLGGGPVVKTNANQAYATDAASAAWFTARCADAGVDVQHFVSRADLPCGSTIGPLTAARLGLPTVDVGPPILSMHSVREQAAADDIGPMVAALRAHLDAPGS